MARMPGTAWRVTKHTEIREFFKNQNKQVVTFVGYSGSGYARHDDMLAVARSVLERYDPADTLINIGATADGIGAVYALAKELGFTTTGIVSARGADCAVSEHVDWVFYVDDDEWGGFMAGTDRLTPTSEAIVANSDVIIGIGGGEVAQQEMLAARRLGKVVEYYPG